MEPFIGQIMAVGFDFAPRGWAKCEGQLLSIAANQALFSLLGTQYGGDGRTTFGLPDLRGRVAIGAGQSPGTGTYRQGVKGGSETVSLSANQMPAHTHGTSAVGVAIKVNSGAGTEATPAAGSSVAALVIPRTAGTAVYNSVNPDVTLNSKTGSLSGNVDMAGAGMPVTNVQPFTVINYIIALNGIFPSRS